MHEQNVDPYDRRIGHLEDLEAVRRLKCEYAEALDRVVNDSGLPEEVTSLCTPGCLWNWKHFGSFQGREAIAKFLAAYRSRVSFGLHFVLGQVIDVASDRSTAAAEWATWQPMTMDGMAMVLAGRYRDQYERTSERWLISSSELDVKLLFPYRTGWVPDRVPRYWRW